MSCNNISVLIYSLLLPAIIFIISLAAMAAGNRWIKHWSKTEVNKNGGDDGGL